MFRSTTVANLKRKKKYVKRPVFLHIIYYKFHAQSSTIYMYYIVFIYGSMDELVLKELNPVYPGHVLGKYTLPQTKKRGERGRY